MPTRLLLIVIAVALAFASDGLAQAPAQIQSVAGEILVEAPGGQSQRLYKNSHALLIGVANYKEWDALPDTQRKVSILGAALQRHGFSVRTMGPQLSSSELRNGILAFIAEVGIGDSSRQNRLLLYFAGHGKSRKGAGFLVPSDAPNADTNSRGFLMNAFPMNDLVEISRQIDALHVGFIIDTCLAGSVFNYQSYSDLLKDAERRQVNGAARHFLAVGSDTQDTPAANTLAESIADILNGIDEKSESRNALTFTELSRRASEVVARTHPSLTPQYALHQDGELSAGEMTFNTNAMPITLRPRAQPTPEMSRQKKNAAGSYEIRPVLDLSDTSIVEWTRWERAYVRDSDSSAAGVVFSATGDMLMFGNRTEPGTERANVRLTKIDPLNRMLFDQTFVHSALGSDYVAAAVFGADQSLLIAATRIIGNSSASPHRLPLVMALGKDGKVEWAKEFLPGKYLDIRSISAAPDGKIWVGGAAAGPMGRFGTQNRAWVATLLANGDQVKEHVFDTAVLEYTNAVHGLANGGALVLGSVTRADQNNRERGEIRLMRLDASFKPVWTWKANLEAFDGLKAMAPYVGGGIVLCGHGEDPNRRKVLKVVALDSSANQLWARDISDTEYNSCHAIAYDEARGIVVGGSKSSPVGFEGYIARLNGRDGQLIWSKSFSGKIGNSSVVRNVSIGRDGTIAGSGHKFIESDGKRSRIAWVVRVDEAGNALLLPADRRQ